MKISTDLSQAIKDIESILPVKKSFDIIGRDLDLGNTKGYLLFIDGFAKDSIMIHILKELQKLKDTDSKKAQSLFLKNVPYIEVITSGDMDTVLSAVMAGQLALFVDGDSEAVLIDAREYPAREPSESNIEKVTRGPRDDLVETIIFNTALIRRRVRDYNMTFEIKSVGKMSKTDVAIGYIGGKADEKLLQKVRDKLDSIDVHALTMGEKSLEELFVKKKWYNPMPTFRMSERPDTIAAHLMEGHIVLLVDASPTALIIPTTLWYFTQYVEDYYQTPISGTLTRAIRFIAIPFSLFLVPLFMLLCLYPENAPQIFKTFYPEQQGEVSLFVQLILLEFGLEVLRLSSLHTPHSMEAAFSIIGGLILGDFAVTMGLFIPDTLFFAVAGTITNHCIPNPELANAVKVFRWFLLLLTGFFGIWGFGAGFVVMTLILVTTKTFDESHPYLWPVIPFNWRAFKHLAVRYPLSVIVKKNGK